MPRILLATLIGIVGLTLYIMASVSLYDRLPDWGWAGQAVYFVFAGLLWVIPARWLMYWGANKSLPRRH